MNRNAGYWQRRFADWRQHGQGEHLLPEVWSLRGCPQPPEYHAEGDAFTHTLLATSGVSPTADERVFWAVLLHDVGKKTTTRFVDDRWRAHGHAEISADMARTILTRLDLQPLADDVAWLIKHHHFALSWGDVEKRGLTKKQQAFCGHRLFPLLVEVCRADSAGSLGGSQKGEWLEKVVTLARQQDAG